MLLKNDYTAVIWNVREGAQFPSLNGTLVSPPLRSIFVTQPPITTLAASLHTSWPWAWVSLLLIPFCLVGPRTPPALPPPRESPMALQPSPALPTVKHRGFPNHLLPHIQRLLNTLWRNKSYPYVACPVFRWNFPGFCGKAPPFPICFTYMKRNMHVHAYPIPLHVCLWQSLGYYAADFTPQVSRHRDKNVLVFLGIRVSWVCVYQFQRSVFCASTITVWYPSQWVHGNPSFNSMGCSIPGYSNTGAKNKTGLECHLVDYRKHLLCHPNLGSPFGGIPFLTLLPLPQQDFNFLHHAEKKKDRLFDGFLPLPNEDF